jgi:hypothetical protein
VRQGIVVGAALNSPYVAVAAVRALQSHRSQWIVREPRASSFRGRSAAADTNPCARGAQDLRSRRSAGQATIIDTNSCGQADRAPLPPRTDVPLARPPPAHAATAGALPARRMSDCRLLS